MDDLDRWTRVLPLGTGAFGQVHLAWDTVDERWVAVKRFTGQDELGLLRFVIESRIRVEHPHLVRTLAFRLVDDRAWLVTDLARGGSMRQLMHRCGPLPWGWVTEAVDQLLDALVALHATGVVHRDLKPANLLLRDAGAVSPHLLVGDFGIATWRTVSMTGIGAAIGTPGYLAPEYLDGSQPSPATDLFAVGVLAAELLAGARLVHTSNASPAIPSDWATTLPLPAEVPAPVAAVLRRMADPDPGRRYADCAQAREALLAAAPPSRRGDLTTVVAPDLLSNLPPGWTPNGPLPTDTPTTVTPTTTGHPTPNAGTATPPPEPDNPATDSEAPRGNDPAASPPNEPAIEPTGHAATDSQAPPPNKPAIASTGHPAAGPATDPQPSPPTQPAIASTAHPAAGPATNPQAPPAREPAIASTGHAAPGPVTDLVPPAEPVVEPPHHPAAEPATALVAQPTTASANESVTTLVAQPAHEPTPPGGLTPPSGSTPPGGLTRPSDSTPPGGLTPPSGSTPPGGLASPGGSTPPAGPAKTRSTKRKPTKPTKPKRRLRKYVFLVVLLLLVAGAGTLWVADMTRTIPGLPTAGQGITSDGGQTFVWSPELVALCSVAELSDIREGVDGRERCQRTSEGEEHWVREPERGFPISNPSGPFPDEDCTAEGDTDYTPVGERVACTDGVWTVTD